MQVDVHDDDVLVRPRPWLIRLPLLREKIDPIAIALILIGSAAVVGFAIKFDLLLFWTEFLRSTAFLRVATYPIVVSVLMLFAGLIFRTILWFHYRPIVVAPEESVAWPSVTVIMSAFNEEEMISDALDSVFRCRYPAERLDVICVDDGSTDQTWIRLKEAKAIYGQRLHVIHFRHNLGKRKALYSAFKKSRGEFVVTVDTDSRIGRSAIRNIVIPLLRNDKVGAVAGRVAALNEKDNFLTRMLSTRYALSFDFGRGYQSVYGTVFCCPGALTAYRMSLIREFIGEWVGQTFLNVPCQHGEDRALTTLVLKSGHYIKYQSNAIVYTRVPKSVGQMNRMYLRWTRSYLRESVLFAKFMFLPYRKKHRLLPILDFVLENLLHPFHVFAMGIIVYSFVVSPLYILRHIALLVILSFFMSLYYLRTQKSLRLVYGIPYALITAFLQWWLVPYAAITIRNQSWLTR